MANLRFAAARERRVALVTGGARGIGRAAALRIAEFSGVGCEPLRTDRLQLLLEGFACRRLHGEENERGGEAGDARSGRKLHGPRG